VRVRSGPVAVVAMVALGLVVAAIVASCQQEPAGTDADARAIADAAPPLRSEVTEAPQDRWRRGFVAPSARASRRRPPSHGRVYVRGTGRVFCVGERPARRNVVIGHASADRSSISDAMTSTT